MAASFFIRTKKSIGTTSLVVRVQIPEKGVDIRKSTPIKVDIEEWKNGQKSPKALVYYRKRKPELWDKLDEIANTLDALATLPEKQLDGDLVGKIVDSIYFREQYEQERKNGEMAFMDYFAYVIEGMKSGRELNEKNQPYSEGTAKRFQLCYNRLQDFQAYRKRPIEWNDIDAGFVADFKYFLQHLSKLWPYRDKEHHNNQPAEDYSINTVGSRLKELKFVMRRYCDRTKTDTSEIAKNANFKASNNNEVDTIYLTEEELERLKNVPLSHLSKAYEKARDLFLVGVWSAQRVSDYNNIRKENIKVRNIVRMEGETEIHETRLIIELTQQKTGRKVVIPVNSQLRQILEKYDFVLPHIADQALNRLLKEICQLAGIDEPVEIRSTKGGKETTRQYPKYELCTSHTARRTGCTLMYLAGMNVFDIMKISGHSTTSMLEKYIKADTLTVADKLFDQYEYLR